MEMMERIAAGGFGDTISVFYGKDHEVWVRGGGLAGSPPWERSPKKSRQADPKWQ